MSALLTLSPTRPCSKKTQLIAQNLKLTDTEATYSGRSTPSTPQSW
jgi:hypothetical protein